MSVNKAIVLGNVGGRPELKQTPGGTSVTHFSVATNENWTDKSGQKQERTEWHAITCFGKLAEVCAQHLDKGRKVYVEGKLRTNEWEGPQGERKQRTEIQAETVQFLDRKETSSMPF